MPPLVPPPSDVPPPGLVVVLRVVVAVVGVVVGAKHDKIESFKAKMYMKLCKMCISKIWYYLSNIVRMHDMSIDLSKSLPMNHPPVVSLTHLGGSVRGS